jgi:hypothetical protein
MAERQERPHDQSEGSLFVKGYFTDRIRKGERPQYGYPANHVPETTFPHMEVETGYLTALRSRK